MCYFFFLMELIIGDCRYLIIIKSDIVMDFIDEAENFVVSYALGLYTSIIKRSQNEKLENNYEI